MKTKTKSLLSMFCVMLVLSIPVLGSLAFLSDSTDEVKNTFTAADIDIKLEESGDLDLKMVPGKELAKDPKATVEANSEACWLFVKIDASANYATYFGTPGYTVADGWTELTSAAGEHSKVFYRTVASSDSDQVFNVLADANSSTTDVGGNGSVVVSPDVTKAQMEAAAADAPTLAFTAYAIQQLGLADAAAAWAAISE